MKTLTVAAAANAFFGVDFLNNGLCWMNALGFLAAYGVLVWALLKRVLHA